MADAPLVTRFAPSPTGHLHVGGARTALFCWALARRAGGRFLLRIEDTDRARSDETNVKTLLEDLRWLGIHWDEGPVHGDAGGDPRGVGPFFQSARGAHYEAALHELLERDLAYPAFETEAELNALRTEAQRQKRDFRYRRPSDFDRAAALARYREGEPCVLRFNNAPREALTVEDEILGAVHFEADTLDDFVLRRRDGSPTYHLAVVVDDEKMGVTHVLRGQEHLNNTPRHLLLQRALGYRVQRYAHLPIILNADGSKMSKRDRDKAVRAALRKRSVDFSELPVASDKLEHWLANKRAQLESAELDALATALGLQLPEISVEDFRRAGYLPEAMLNVLALLGWSPGEKLEDGRDLERFDPDYLAAHFSLARARRSSARFDRNKMLAFNQQHLTALGDEDFTRRFHVWAKRYPAPPHGLSSAQTGALLQMLRPRCQTFSNFLSVDGPGGFAVRGDADYPFDPKAVTRWLATGEPTGLELLPALRDVLAAQRDFEPQPVERAIAAFCEARSLELKVAAQALRVAVTGSARSPGLGETLAVLGRDAVLARIRRCLAECQRATPGGRP